MIEVTITKQGETFLAFESKGHAGFAEEGRDIICSAVSALTINTVNSIDAFTEDMIHVHNEEGYLAWEFVSRVNSHEAKLLMDSLVLGLSQIQDNYDKEYLKITFKEV